MKQTREFSCCSCIERLMIDSNALPFHQVSNWIVVMISLDRFLALWFPQTTRLRSVSTAKIMVVVIVVVAFGDSLRYYWMRDVDVITGETLDTD